MDLEKAFVQFLKSKKALGKFRKNLKTPARKYKKVKTLKKLIHHLSATPEDWIRYAFYWALTPEGVWFWKDLNDEWVDFLRKNGLKI